MEAQLCAGEEIIVVGGGNSAGQAAVFLAETVQKVCMLVRGKALSDTMSRYLIQRIVENPGIELHLETEIVGLAGDPHLEQVTWRDREQRAKTSTRHIRRHVFVMVQVLRRAQIGCVTVSFLINKGSVLYGRELRPGSWPPRR